MQGALTKFVELTSDRLRVLRNAVQEVRDGDVGAAETVRRMARSLAGAAREHGLSSIEGAAELVEAAGAPDDLVTRALALLRLLEPADRPRGPARVLVIEDEATSALLLQALIAHPQREVQVVGTARDAERVLEEGADVDLILLDLVLPDADGRDFLVRLKERRETASTPVIVLSALPAGRARAECLALGAQDYLEKSRMSTDAAALVARHLEGGAARRILLVEDDPVTARLVEFRLQKDGFEVHHYDDGSAALAAAEVGFYALAILDVKLAGMDGFELLQRIREMDHFREVPVIMLTGMGRDEDIVRGFDLGSDDYILKPFSPAELMARIHRLLED